VGRLLKIADALLFRAVRVLVEGDAGFLRGLDKVIGDRAVEPQVGHLLRSADAMVGIGAALLVLRLHEIGQHLGIAPAGVPRRRPLVVILALAADVEQAVERAGAAEHLAARPLQAAVGNARVGFGDIAPVQLRVVHGLEIADRDVDPGIPVFATGLEQQHAVRRVFRQPAGQHAAGRSGTDHDVVERERHSPPSPRSAFPDSAARQNVKRYVSIMQGRTITNTPVWWQEKSAGKARSETKVA
jgi:hypothetical protein